MMRAVLFDGTQPGNDRCRQGSDALRRALSDAGWAVEFFSLAELPMAPCRGCFACWTATPGRCPFEDASQPATAAYVRSGLAVLYAPLAFGAWPHSLKKLLDRMICLVSPHFEAEGLTRHRARYFRSPLLLGAGWTPSPDPEAEAVFARLVEHNAWNLRAPGWQALVLADDRPWAAQLQACRAAVGRLAA